MAALRQLLSTREMQGALYPRALPEESRQMVKSKMEAMGYPLSAQPPAVPEKEQPSKKSDYDPDQSLKPVRYQENSQARYDPESGHYDRSAYTSVYEQRLSQDISSALSNHLALRPRNPRNNSETNISQTIHEHRRRSRSAVEDAMYDSNAWNDYNTSAQHQRMPREDSRSASQPPRHLREGSEPIPDRLGQRSLSPEMEKVSSFPSSAGEAESSYLSDSKKGAFQPLANIGHNNKKRNPKHSNNESIDPSPSNSVGSGVKHTLPAVELQPLERSRKRRRDDDLDYSLEQLESKTYSELASESFDHNPPSFFAENTLIKRLPSSSIPLSSRLQAVFESSTNRMGLSKTLFASLTIDKYDECGDLLLEKFSDIMKRLKEARQIKRKACRAMEDEVAQREQWVRRKRACVEGGLGRLRMTGMSVIRPRGNGK